MFRNVAKDKQKIDTQKTQDYVISLAKKMLKNMKFHQDIKDMVTSDEIIASLTTLLRTDPARLAMSDAQIENLLNQIATKQLLKTYLALHRMTLIDSDLESQENKVYDQIFNIAIKIKSEYTKSQCEALFYALINDSDTFTQVKNGNIDQAKLTIKKIIQDTTGMSAANLIDFLGEIKFDDKKSEALIGTSPTIKIPHKLQHIPVANIRSPNGSPINSPVTSPGTSPETNVSSAILFSKKSNFSHAYPGIPGDSPFVTPENSPQKPKQQGVILSTACKEALKF